jgi:hypothetical protein
VPLWPLWVVGPSRDKERQGVLFPVPKTRFSAMMRGEGAHESDLGVDGSRTGSREGIPGLCKGLWTDGRVQRRDKGLPARRHRLRTVTKRR